MKLEAWLKNRGPWLLFPTVWSNLFALMLVLVWAASSRAWVDDAHQAMVLTWGALATGLAQVSLVLIALTRLRTFRGIAAGRVGLRVEPRLQALRELRGLPTTVATLNFLGWLLVAGGLGLAMVLGAQAPWSSAARVMVGALVAGPLSTILLSLHVTSRTWEAFDRLAHGLKPSEVIAAAPAVEWSIRGRMVLFTLAMTVLPLVFVADVAWESLRDASSVLASAAAVDRPAVGQALLSTLLLRLVGLAGLGALFAAATASAAGRTIAQPMQRLAEDGRKIAAGQLGQPRVIAADGEVWRVTGVFAQLCERLATLLDTIVDVTVQVQTATESLVRTTERSESAATEQGASLHETSATTEELARSARQIAQSAASVQELARLTLAAAEQGQTDAAAFDAAVARMTQDNRTIAAAVTRLQRRVQQIGRIVELINTVADRSDLLALSAELEGSKAGDAGRGFALVGAEMRRLAENVLESTSEVDELIAEIRAATLKTSSATEEGSRLTEHGTSLAGDVTTALQDVARLAADTSTRARTITLSTQQQQSGTDQLAESMNDILRATKGELEATHQSAQLNQQLIALASSLQSVVRRFGVKAGP